MSWLATIALLCQITVATGERWTRDSSELQLSCQKELIKCYRKNEVKSESSDQTVADCVLKREAE